MLFWIDGVLVFFEQCFGLFSDFQILIQKLELTHIRVIVEIMQLLWCDQQRFRGLVGLDELRDCRWYWWLLMERFVDVTHCCWGYVELDLTVFLVNDNGRWSSYEAFLYIQAHLPYIEIFTFEVLLKQFSLPLPLFLKPEPFLFSLLFFRGQSWRRQHPSWRQLQQVCILRALYLILDELLLLGLLLLQNWFIFLFWVWTLLLCIFRVFSCILYTIISWYWLSRCFLCWSLRNFFVFLFLLGTSYFLNDLVWTVQ